MKPLSRAEQHDRQVLSEVIERRRLKQPVRLRDIGLAVNLSVGAVHNVIRRLELRRLLKEQPCDVVELGPAPTPRAFQFLRKAG